jgi:hypothetical protein
MPVQVTTKLNIILIRREKEFNHQLTIVRYLKAQRLYAAMEHIVLAKAGEVPVHIMVVWRNGCPNTVLNLSNIAVLQTPQDLC